MTATITNTGVIVTTVTTTTRPELNPDTVHVGLTVTDNGKTGEIISVDWMNDVLRGVVYRTATGEVRRIPGGLFTLDQIAGPARPRPETLADMLTAAAYALDAPAR